MGYFGGDPQRYYRFIMACYWYGWVVMLGDWSWAGNPFDLTPGSSFRAYPYDLPPTPHILRGIE